MPHSFARRPEDLRADRAESRRRVLICVGSLFAVLAGFVLWHYFGHYLRSTPQPTEPRKITVDGQEKLVSLSLWRSGTMGGSPPFIVTVCADGTVVCDLEEFTGDRWDILRRTTDRASPDQLAALDGAFAHAKFMDRLTNYTGGPAHTDCPYFEIYRLDGGRWKLVRYYSGAECVPEELHALTKVIWNTLALDRWIPDSGTGLEKLRAESAQSARTAGR